MARMGTWAILAPLALVPLMVGCDSKSDGLPTAPPLAAQQPADILPHLQYLATSKDYKHIILIAPISPDVVFPSARWFHSQARSLGIELTPEEMKALDVEDLAPRLDTALPTSPEPGYDITEARHAFNAGIYRLLKGFDASVWKRMNVMEVRGNPANRRVEDVTLGVNGQPLIVVSCLKKDNNTWGVSNIQYKVGKGYQPK